jgi:hypothetical protein
MVDACGNRLKGPPSIFDPHGKVCFTRAFSTWDDTSFTPCVASAPRSAMPARRTGFADSVPADFTPVAVATGPASVFGAAGHCTKWQCKHDLIETVHDGRRAVMCPVAVADNVSRNCVSAMKRVWQCDRFLARGDLDGYNKCRQMEKCFQYDITLPNGNRVPIAVKANDVCLEAAGIALQQAASQCVNGTRAPCTTQRAWR